MRSDGSELLRDVHLHGALGERFGSVHRLSIATPAEAVRALSFQHHGFRRAISEGHWRIVRGEPETGLALGEDQLHFRLGKAPLHIVPVVVGAGGHGGAVGKIVAGLAIAAGSFLIPGSTPFLIAAGNAAFGVGLSMALQGASALLTSKPVSANGRGGVDERASFIFSAPANVSAQGGCVPIVIGRFRVGSIVISAGLQAEQATT